MIKFLFLIACIPTLLCGQQMVEPTIEKKERMAWWTEARFGMFIHFGLYSLPAEHAWYKSKNNLTNAQYQKYFEHFNPDLLDAPAWAKIARQAGMKYMVITTKHHDGFCLWDSKFTDYKVTNTPYGKDIIRQVVDAFRKEDIRVGFYYSLIDWHHPEYTTDHKHPLRDDPDYVAMDKNRNMQKYREYMQNQVKELVTGYGQIDLLFMDFSFPAQEGYAGKGSDDWGSEELLKIVRQYQPQCIVNDRLDLLDDPVGWDFRTPEQFMPDKWVEMDGKKVPWEACHTLSEKWTYATAAHAQWKTEQQLIEMLIETVSKGGNILLNAGPNGRGEIDPKSRELLNGIVSWMHYNSRSIYGSTQAPDEIVAPNGTMLTYNQDNNRLYVHLIRYPYKEIKLTGLKGKVSYAQFLHDASEIKLKKQKGAWLDEVDDSQHTVTLSIPIEKPDVQIPVIEVILE